MNTLLIINPQNDYIEENGTMYNPIAQETLMNVISLLETTSDINQVVLAMENHPEGYCGFITEGGDDPVHCVENTWGSKIPKKLKTVLKSIDNRTINFGEIESQNETSVSPYSENIDNMFILKTSTDYAAIHNDNIIICSFGPISYIQNTINDLLKCKNITVQICENCITNIDESFMNFIKKNNISNYNIIKHD